LELYVFMYVFLLAHYYLGGNVLVADGVLRERQDLYCFEEGRKIRVLIMYQYEQGYKLPIKGDHHL